MKNGILIILLLISVAMIGMGTYSILNKSKPNQPNNEKPVVNPKTNDFNINIIKEISKTENKNFLISPYSIEIALSMLKEGSSGTTLSELEKVVPTRKISFLSIKDRISIANALFIKNEYKSSVKKTFSDALVSKYSSELLYDDFKDAKVINNWVDQKTSGMIKKVVNDDELSNMILALANAIAIDVEWENQFDCSSTKSDDFITQDGIKKVEMMTKTFSNYSNAKYIKTDNEVGILLPYKYYKSDGTSTKESSSNTTNLEFIAVLPKNDINTYINNLTNDKLDGLFNSFTKPSEKEEVYLSIPRFEYDYDWQNFKDSLKNIGLKDAMGPNPDFTKIIDDVPVHIGKAVHKTHISLNEKGTKAAAVTYFQLDRNSIIIEKDRIDIKFDKPFMYFIRDNKSSELLFFGIVKEPNMWKGSTCSNEK